MPYRRSNMLCWSIMIAQIVSYKIYGQGITDEGTMMILLSILGWSALIHQIYWLLYELQNVLKVRLFHIKCKD